MGQSPSAALDQESFGFLSARLPVAFAEQAEGMFETRDFTDEIPDELLACIFKFLGSVDRKRCSMVCKRWFRVEGQSRHRLSLNAQAGILDRVPSIFARFDRVTRLGLRCDRKAVSLNDDALVLISLRCWNLTCLKLRGCREVTDEGMVAFAQNCRNLRKLSCGSCTFGAKALNAVLDFCPNLEDLSVKRLRGIHEGAELVGPGTAASSLKSICLKELINGQCFEPLLAGSKKLKTLKIIRCFNDWDNVLGSIAKPKQNGSNHSLMEIHLERVQVSDAGLSFISKCSNIEALHIVKAPECSNLGLMTMAENCSSLRKLHIDGWRTNRIGDEGLIAVAKHCTNLQELVLIGVNVTHLSLFAIACSCTKLERLALCGSGSIGDAEIACIAAKCTTLKKLCIKGCPISDVGIEALAWGCPNLVKIKVKKCKRVSSEAAEWLQGRRNSMIINMDTNENDSAFDASSSESGANESGMEFPSMAGLVHVSDASTNSIGRFALLRTKLGLLAGRNLVACSLRRWSNGDDSNLGNL